MTTDERMRNTGLITFFISGLCAISSGIIVSILREKYGFSFGVTGMLLSFMSIGNVIASFLSGILPAKIGARNTVLVLGSGYFLGYALMTFTGITGFLILAFLMVGLAKGCALNNCTVLVGNHSRNRTRGMSLMHSFYAMGALICPILISFLAGINKNFAMAGVALAGLAFWLVFFSQDLDGGKKETAGGDRRSDFSFLENPVFWVLTALVFCQNAAETSVTGWLVTYYKDENILSGLYANYTMTVMWTATLIARLLIAFVFPVRDTFKVLTFYGFGCTLLYAVLITLHAPLPALAALFAFAFMMAPINPVAVAGVGKQMSTASMGVLFPVSSIGAIVMPYIIGIAADCFGLQAGMYTNIIPCAGITVLSFIMVRISRTKTS